MLGTDPATDLRGAGVLGLINLLHILKDGKKHQLASDIYRLSLHPTQVIKLLCKDIKCRIVVIAYKNLWCIKFSGKCDTLTVLTINFFEHVSLSLFFLQN